LSNPYREMYTALWDVLAKSEDVRAVADIVSQGEGGQGVTRRKLDPEENEEGKRVRVFLVPRPGGAVKSISSTHSRVIEKFTVASASGFVSHADIMSLKWGIVKALWANRTLGLAFVERTDVDALARRPNVGTNVLGERAITWDVDLVISVTMYFDRNDLPMA